MRSDYGEQCRRGHWPMQVLGLSEWSFPEQTVPGVSAVAGPVQGPSLQELRKQQERQTEKNNQGMSHTAVSHNEGECNKHSARQPAGQNLEHRHAGEWGLARLSHLVSQAGQQQEEGGWAGQRVRQGFPKGESSLRKRSSEAENFMSALERPEMEKFFPGLSWKLPLPSPTLFLPPGSAPSAPSLQEVGLGLSRSPSGGSITQPPASRAGAQ